MTSINVHFPTDYQSIWALLDNIDPVEYARSRNYLKGAVTRLSPYISRGVISTRQIVLFLQEKGYHFEQMEKLVQEFAWREFFQRVWQAKKELISSDLLHPQLDMKHTQMPTAILAAQTQVDALDAAIRQLYETGYLHNHLRMYLAMLTCNIAKAYWLMPAKWMYYHLLDADWASNACSWQWVAGVFSNKKYYANQENINRYTETNQLKTLLDVEYEGFNDFKQPKQFQGTQILALETQFPTPTTMGIDERLPIHLYHFYHLDPVWRKEEAANRVLLLEPPHFRQYPIAQHSMDFMLALANNIPNIQVFIGEFAELKKLYPNSIFYTKEHPIVAHYQAEKDERDWLFPEITGFYPSFFKYWNKCQTLTGKWRVENG